MHELSPREIFDHALISDFGIEIVLDDYTASRSVRRRLYAEREKFRADGCTDYDCLSFLIKGCDILVVPRDRVPKAVGIKTLDCRPLSEKELLKSVLNRGINRLKRDIS